jgi:hypothetical protein
VNGGADTAICEEQSTAVADLKRFLFDKGVIALAGRVAEKRAVRPSPDGWVLFVSPERRVSIHEAAHGIAGIASGRFVHEVSVIPCERMNGYVTWWSQSAVPAQPMDRENVERDHSQAARAAALLAPHTCPQWKAVRETVRTMRRRAEQIIEGNWLEVLELANALEKHKVLDRTQIESLVRTVTIAP